MFYGLSYLDDEIMADKLSEIIAYGPCFLINIDSDLVVTDSLWKYSFAEYLAQSIDMDHAYQFGNGVSVQTVGHFN